MVKPVTGKVACPLLLLHSAAAVPDRHGCQVMNTNVAERSGCLVQDYDQYARGGFLSY